MMLSEVINSGAPPGERFAARSERDNENPRPHTDQNNRACGVPSPPFVCGKAHIPATNNYTYPAKFLRFCDYKGRLSRQSRVREYQTGTRHVNLYLLEGN